MEIIGCVSERSAKNVIWHLTNCNEKFRPVSGAIVNIIIDNICTAKLRTVSKIISNEQKQSIDIYDCPFEISMPLIIDWKNFNKWECINKLSEESFFINCFDANEQYFPNNTGIIKHNGMMQYFIHYSLKGNSRPILGYCSKKIAAFSNFYHFVLEESSTAEGSVIQVYLLKLLFNSVGNDENICENNRLSMCRFINNELQQLDGDECYNIDDISRKYHNKEIDVNIATYNDLEYKTLKSFITAFNKLSANDKKMIRTIFNESSKMYK